MIGMAISCKDCPLRKKPLFVDMTKEELAFMEHFKVGELTVEPGTPLLSEGTNTPQIFTALRGMGLRYKLLENGRRQVVSFVFPGDFIGLQAGVMRDMQHSVEATTRMVLCVFDRSELWSLFRNQPDRAFDLTWLAANEERFLGEALATIGQRDAIQRVAWALGRIYRRLKAVGLLHGATVPLPYRQQDLADALGLSLVHTNKTLAKLRDRQIVNWSDGDLRIDDLVRLDEIAMIEDSELSPRPLI